MYRAGNSYQRLAQFTASLTLEVTFPSGAEDRRVRRAPRGRRRGVPDARLHGGLRRRWTDDTMIAAHHFQMFQKEHGAWAHNSDYMAQLLIDSMEALGTDVSGYNRP